jgi:acyl carrier protein
MTILDKVKKTVAEKLGISEDIITEQSALVVDLKADSLDIAAMLYDMEAEFNLEFPDEEIKDLKTVGDVARLLESKTS